MSQDIRNIPNSWVMVPAAWRVDAPPSPKEQKWLMTLSGIADINFRGDSTAAWRHETFNLYFDYHTPLVYAHGGPPPTGLMLDFEVELWTQFATINSIYDSAQAIDAGFAVDSCNPVFAKGVRYFNYLEVMAAVRDTDAYLFKIAFQLTMLGKIRLLEAPN